MVGFENGVQRNLGRRVLRPPNRRFKLQKRRQLFIGVHNDTLSVAAMRVSYKDRAPVAIQSRNADPTPTGFAEIASDDFR